MTGAPHMNAFSTALGNITNGDVCIAFDHLMKFAPVGRGERLYFLECLAMLECSTRHQDGGGVNVALPELARALGFPGGCAIGDEVTVDGGAYMIWGYGEVPEGATLPLMIGHACEGTPGDEFVVLEHKD